MGDTWICSNCGAENTMKFCTKCGTPKPVVETPAPEVQQAASWDCVCGNTGNTGNFCRKCGRSREQGTVIAAEVPELEIPEMPEELPEAAEAVPAAAAAVAATVSEVEVPEVEIPEAEMPEIEIPEVEIPEVEIPEAEMPEIEIPEVELPEVEIPEAEVPELDMPEADNTWTCVCGQMGNVGNFCRNCGTPKPLANVVPAAAVAAGLVGQETPAEEIPQVEMPLEEGPQLEIPSTDELQDPAPILRVAAPPEGPWDCPCGKTGNLGKFCSVCGTPRERGFAPGGTVAATPLEVQPESAIKTGMEEPIMGEPEIPQPQPMAGEGKKKKSFKPLIIIIAAVVVVAAIVVALIFLLPKKYTVNHYTATEQLEVTKGFSVLSDKDYDISFLYPDELLADRKAEGDYIYGDKKDAFPFILINRVNEPTKVQTYFKAYEQYMKSEYPDLEFSEIHEVPVEGKTLYMVSTHIPDVDIDQDMYIELYDDFYILYTVAGYESGTDNSELYYAIGSLRPSADAYPVPEMSTIENTLGNFSVEVPDDFDVDEFSAGLYAEKGNTGLFAAYFNSDLLGTIIYDREDFHDRSQRVTGYLEELLGVTEVTLYDNTVTKINGREYDLYPIDVVLNNGELAEGKLAIGECDSNVGIYLICYYLEENTGSIQEEQAEQFLQSVKVYGDPNNTFYKVENADSAGLGIFAYDSSDVGDVKVDSTSVTITSPDGKQKVILEKLEGPEVYNAAEKIAQDLANQHSESYLAELEDPEDGRYYYHGAEITYETSSGEKHVYRIFGVESNSGNVYCMHYDVIEGEEAWADGIVDDLIWSWKLN